MDRRQAERFPTRLRCYVVPIGLMRRYLSGTCENLSRVGVLVRCTGTLELAASLAVGDDIDVYIELPTKSGRGRERCLLCAGTICALRTGPAGEPEIAATIHHMRFRNLPPDFSRDKTLAALEESYPLM